MKINNIIISPQELAEQMTYREIKEFLSLLNIEMSKEIENLIQRLDSAKLWFNDMQLSALLDQAIFQLLLCASEKEENERVVASRAEG